MGKFTCRVLVSLAFGFFLASSGLVLVQGKAPPRDASIAIIGGGVHGLLLANELSRAGYRKLTVFEASEQVVPIACTVEVGGKPYDCSITIWPADHLEDGSPPGPPTNAVKLLQQASATFGQPPQIIPFLNTNTASREVLPPFLQAAPGTAATNMTDVRVQLLQVWKWLYELNQHPRTPLGVIQSGIAMYNETFGEWVQRRDVPIHLAIEDYKWKATVTGADVAALPAAVVLNLARLYPSVIKVALYVLGQDPEDPTVHATLHEPLQLCKDSAGEQCYFWMPLREGHRKFFEDLAEALPGSVDVRTSTAAVSVRPAPDGSVTVAYDAAGQLGEQRFSRAVLAVRAADAQQMLLPSDPAMQLYNAVTLGGHPRLRTLLTHGFVYSLSEESADVSAAELVGSQLLQDGGKTTFAGYTVPVDLPHLVNGTPSSAMYLHPAGRGLAVATLADTTLLPRVSDVEEATRDTLLRMGFPIAGVVQGSVKRFQFPEFVSPEVQRGLDVFAEFEALQGQDGIYYTGEALAGPSVVAGLDFVQDMVQRHFT